VSEDLDPPPGRGAVMWGLRTPDGDVLPVHPGEDVLRVRAIWEELGQGVDVVNCRALDDTGATRTPWRAAQLLKVTT
jgi:hypothetical protein